MHVRKRVQPPLIRRKSVHGPSNYRLGLGLGPGNVFYSFFFFSALKSDEHLVRCHLWQCGVSAT